MSTAVRIVIVERLEGGQAVRLTATPGEALFELSAQFTPQQRIACVEKVLGVYCDEVVGSRMPISA